jgi:pSer/pThr/pTyr-binding forkhead associated (FHA) protein
VVVDDPAASKRHARVIWSEESAGCTLEDLASSNGTLINGRPVSKAAPLKDHDVVRFGASEFVFVLTPSLRGRLILAMS